MSKKSRKSRTSDTPKPETTATALATALEAAGITPSDETEKAATHADLGAVMFGQQAAKEAGFTTELQPEAATTSPLETATGIGAPIDDDNEPTADELKPPKAAEVLAKIAEAVAEAAAEPTTTEAELTEAQKAELEALKAATLEVERAATALAAARAKLISLKKGPAGPSVDADGKPLSAGKKAWLTRLARGTAPPPKPKTPHAPIDPNAPNLTAGQKAWLTRQARQADPNYKPEGKTPKVNATERLETAIAAAFPGPGEVYGNGTRVYLS
jgi:hypothetical protein